jgi:primosomal protein N'
MNIITVIPLTRSKIVESLSYFTSADVPVGAIVSVPLRSKSIHAIVAESRIASDLKAEIKSAPYEIRKLNKVKATAFFPVPFMEAAKKLAHYYVGNVGAVIDALTADVLLENASKLESPGTPQGHALSRRLNLESSTFAVQGDDDDRMSSWRSLIRQEFARKKSVAVFVPTIEDAENITSLLTKGIEGYIFTLHGSLPKKKILDTWKAIASMTHPVVVIATASFSLLPRSDIDTVVIERENGRGWISQKTPYIDLRHSLEVIAHTSGQVVHRADSMLRVETLRRLDDQEISQGSPFKWRSISLANDYLINMTKKNVIPVKAETVYVPTNEVSELKGTEKIGSLAASVTEEDVHPLPREVSRFRVLSPELEQLINNNRDESTHLFIYTVRRGMSPITVCDDCETIVTCNNCSSPVVLHTSKDSGRNFFMCHMCGERRSADETCKNCGSWRLTALGIGIERVEEEIKAKFPGIDLFKIDSDTTSTDKQIKEVLEKFKSKPGSILIGTELALAHLREKIDHVAVASMDSLFSLPDFRIPEKVMYALVRLRGLASKSIIVQTRRPEEKVFEFGLKGNLSDFYRSTLEERKQFKYPPYSTLIKITAEGKKDPIARLMSEIKTMIEPNEMDIFPAFTAALRGNSVIHGLIRVEPYNWPLTELMKKLKSLPPSVNIRIDPETLL